MSTKLAYLRHYLILFSFIYTFLFPQYSWAYFATSQDPILILRYNDSPVIQNNEEMEDSSDLTIFQGNSLIAVNNPVTPEQKGPSCPVYASKKSVIITAYSSTPEETDGSPFITASGTYVRDGIIAANFLKIGAKVKIPALYGDKIFVVEDRMAKKNSHKVDIWMSSKSQALKFGVKRAEIEVLEL